MSRGRFESRRTFFVCDMLCGGLSRGRTVVQIKGLLEVPFKSGDQMLCSLQLKPSKKSPRSRIFAAVPKAHAVVRIGGNLPDKVSMLSRNAKSIYQTDYCGDPH